MQAKKILKSYLVSILLISLFQRSKIKKKDSHIYIFVVAVLVSKKTVEEESRSFFNCSGLYLFSQDEVLKATNHFDDSNLIGEATLGMNYEPQDAD